MSHGELHAYCLGKRQRLEFLGFLGALQGTQELVARAESIVGQEIRMQLTDALEGETAKSQVLATERRRLQRSQGVMQLIYRQLSRSDDVSAEYQRLRLMFRIEILGIRIDSLA